MVMSLPAAAERARLAAIAEYGVIDASPDDPVVEALNALCELAVLVTDLPHAVVNILDDRLQHQVATFGTEATACAREDAMCATTLAAGTNLYVPDASVDPRFEDSPWVDGRLGEIRAYYAVILYNPDRLPLGTLCVYDEQPRQLQRSQMRALQLLAGRVVDQLELHARRLELERSNAALAVSQDRLAAFAGQISHDLKAPITAIMGFTELLSEMDSVVEDPTVAGYVGRCASSAKRMLAMIDDLLAFARVGASLTPTAVHLDDVMPEVLEDLGSASEDATVRWSGPAIVGDRQQIRALLQNLVGNALKYRRAEVPAVVDVRTERLGSTVVLAVADNGSGIPPDRREDVLRPLVRLRKDVGGAGLGLALCARIVAAHGGTLRIEDGPDGPDRGTTMIAVLPQPERALP
jgi:signal transduction histidine kinase